MPADPRTRRRSTPTVAACLVATVLTFAIASADAADEVARARALEADGRIDVAVEHLRIALTDESVTPRPAVLLELARLTDDASEAMALADEVLRTTRDNDLRIRAHVMRGDYLYAAGHYEQAAVEYAAAAEQGVPGSPSLRLAASLLATGDTAGAIDAYNDAASSDSESIVAWAAIGRGRARLAAGDAEEAVGELEQAAEDLAGRSIRVHALMAAADANFALGDLLRARELLLLVSGEFAGSFEATLAADRVESVDRRLIEIEELAALARATIPPTDGAGTAAAGAASPDTNTPDRGNE